MELQSVMIIDDSELDREMLTRLIKRANLSDTIFEADDGQSALEFLQDYEKNQQVNEDRFPPTLIFLDINMPRVNGFEFLSEFAQLRESDERYESAVLTMFSSSEREEDKEKAFSYPFVKGFIVKMPRNAEELKESVRRHFPDIKFSE